MPRRTYKTTAILSLALQEGERVLWSECNGRGGKDTLGTGIFCAVVFLAIYGGFAYWSHTDASLTPQVMKLLEFFIVLALLSLVYGFYYAAAEKRRLYALTNRRALIITPRPLAKPLLCSLPAVQNLIFCVNRHADTTADYLMCSSTYGKGCEDKDGFRRITDTQGLETTLSQLGIAIPQPGEKRTALFCKKPHFTPAAKTLLLAAALYMVSGAFLPVVIESTAADLYLHGERATATIIGSKRITRLDTANVTVSGSTSPPLTKHDAQVNRTVTLHYPILSYKDAALGSVRITHNHGAESPPWSYGQQIDILYTPGDTTRIILDTAATRTNAYLYLGLIALALLWLLWQCTKTIRQARRSRHLPYLSEEIAPATAKP